MDVLSSRMSLISSASFPVPLSPFFVSSLSVSTCLLLIFNFSFFVIPSSYLTLLLLTHLMYIHSLFFHIYFLIFLPASIYSLHFFPCFCLYPLHQSSLYIWPIFTPPPFLFAFPTLLFWFIYKAETQWPADPDVSLCSILCSVQHGTHHVTVSAAPAILFIHPLSLILLAFVP